MADAKQTIASLLTGRTLADLGNYLSPSNTSWAPWPVMAARTTLSALAAPHDAYTGALPMMDSSGHTSLAALGRAADLAGLMTLGGGAVPAESGSVFNAGLSGLRQRYAPYLSAASGGKDPARIKLTPQRVEAAKEAMRTGFGLYPEGKPSTPIGAQPSPYRTTEQAQQAAQFASQARQAVDGVRVKFPEGPNGSVYVRVGNNGTVRFADHPPPMDNGQIVGGYSRDLGRRHQPATVDVSSAQRGMPLNTQPAYDFLAALLRGDAT